MHEGPGDGPEEIANRAEQAPEEIPGRISVAERVIENVAVGIQRLRVGHVLHERISRQEPPNRRVPGLRRGRLQPGRSCARDRRCRAARGRYSRASVPGFARGRAKPTYTPSSSPDGACPRCRTNTAAPRCRSRRSQRQASPSGPSADSAWS